MSLPLPRHALLCWFILVTKTALCQQRNSAMQFFCKFLDGPDVNCVNCLSMQRRKHLNHIKESPWTGKNLWALGSGNVG